ncbi:MAG: acyl-CoA dehydrogenase family protein [Syntrophomonadales bacterium]|jgi:alkylation response protein AidB-like acyl-CoA dehydrogenase
MISLDLTREQKRIVEKTRGLVREEITPKSLEIDAKGDDQFDWSIANLLSKHNLLCPTIPKEYGGLGMNHLTCALLIEEISTGCAGVATVLNASIHAASPIVLAGTREQKESFLPLLTSTTPALAAFALTEPGAGSDIESISSSAEAEGKEYVITGTKDFVLNASVASFFSAFVFIPPFSNRAALRAFIIPASTPGLSLGRVRNKVGIRYANTSEVLFDQVRVSADNMVGGNRSGSGYLLLTQTLDRGRALVGAVAVGIAQAAFNLALNHARTRVQFGKPIMKNQAVSFALAEMATKIELARLMTWKACWLIDQDRDYTTASSMAKWYASETALEVTSKAVEILGAGGYMANTYADKYSRDARVLATVEGTNNIQKAIIASLL